jgi:hypothetical protein
MMNSVTLDNAALFHAECQRVREHAEMILAEARLLQEQLDQTGGLLNLALQTQATTTHFVPLTALNASHLQPTLVAA